MDGDSQSLLISVIILIGLACFFAIAETSLSAVSRNKIKNAADRGDSRAKNVLKALDQFDRAITTLLICTNIVHTAVASIVTVYVTRHWGLSAVTISTILTTIIVFFAGEMVPKSIAKKNSENCALATAGIVLLFMKLCLPLSIILSWIGELASKVTKAEPEITVTEDELYDIIEDMEEEGAIDEAQSDLFSSALQFSEVTVDSIITPRVDMVAIGINDDPKYNLDLIRQTNHSRLPVYEKTPDNIIGILPIRKYLKAYLEFKSMPDIRSLMDEPYYTHQSVPIDELLENMSEKKVSLAVISDIYGGTLGIVTIEDILEELVGEIWDEDDKVEESIVQITQNSYIIDAEETVNDALEAMEIDPLEEDEEEFMNLQVGEWVYMQFTEIPSVGDSFMYRNLIVTVEEMDKNRILHVRFAAIPAQEGGEA